MSKRQTSAVLTGQRQIQVEKRPVPDVGAGEILMRVRACSICGSDIRIFNHGNDRVEYPAIIGHEMSGQIVEVGNRVEAFRPGDRICIGADVPSMLDEWSLNGMANLADINYAIGYQFPGGYSEYCLLNELTVRYGPLAIIPEGVSYEEASLTEPLACCINGLERAYMEPGKSVLIVGAGPIGIMLARTARAFGADKVLLTDSDPVRTQIVHDLGEEHIHNLQKDSLEFLMNKYVGNRGFDIILTACSNPDAQEAVIPLIAKRGVINFFGGLPKNARNIQMQSNILHYKEAYITGSHGSSPRQFRLALKMIAAGRIKVKDIITHKFMLQDIEKAFETAESRRGLKVTVTPCLD